MNIERQYKPIEAPKSRVVKYLKAFNYAFLPMKVKILLLLYSFCVGYLYFFTPTGLFMALMLPLGAIFGVIALLGYWVPQHFPSIFGYNSQQNDENIMLSPKYFWLPGNAFNQDKENGED